MTVDVSKAIRPDEKDLAIAPAGVTACVQATRRPSCRTRPVAEV